MEQQQELQARYKELNKKKKTKERARQSSGDNSVDDGEIPSTSSAAMAVDRERKKKSFASPLSSPGNVSSSTKRKRKLWKENPLKSQVLFPPKKKKKQHLGTESSSNIRLFITIK